MKRITVLVFDQSHPNLGQRLALAFQYETAVVYSSDGRVTKAQPQGNAVHTFPAHFDLVVLHHSDEPAWLALNRTSRITVRYTSVAPVPPSEPPGEHWIQQAFDISNGRLDITQATELLIWVRAVVLGQPTAYPKLLEGWIKTFDVLPALSLLCEGFLAIHWDPALDRLDPELDIDDTDTYDVLMRKELGWPDFVRERGANLLRSELFDADARRALQATVVRDSLWWRLSENEQVLASVLFECGVRDEQALPPALRTLLQAIGVISQPGVDLFPNIRIVGQAYKAIKEILSEL